MSTQLLAHMLIPLYLIVSYLTSAALAHPSLLLDLHNLVLVTQSSYLKALCSAKLVPDGSYLTSAALQLVPRF